MKRLTMKGAKQLPSKVALTDLDQSQRTLTDYSKLSPIKPNAETSDEYSGLLRTIAKGRPR